MEDRTHGDQGGGLRQKRFDSNHLGNHKSCLTVLLIHLTTATR